MVCNDGLHMLLPQQRGAGQSDSCANHQAGEMRQRPISQKREFKRTRATTELGNYASIGLMLNKCAAVTLNRSMELLPIHTHACIYIYIYVYIYVRKNIMHSSLEPCNPQSLEPLLGDGNTDAAHDCLHFSIWL